MGAYVLKRLLLIVPTLVGIMLLNFLIVHFAPGGPVDYALSRMQKAGEQSGSTPTSAPTRMATWDESVVKDLKKLYGFDKPLWQRFLHMMKNYLVFDFGESYFKSDTVARLILSKIPVSLSLGLWAALVIYMISIPLGIAKAVHNGSPFDTWTSVLMIVGYAVPSFLFGLALIIFFAGGSFWSWFPLKGLTSPEWRDLSWWGKVKDYFWHLALPTLAQVLGSFASLTLLIKNSFLEEIQKQYVITARAQGLTEKAILFKSIFRNAMLIILAGLPSKLLLILFSGSFLIEMIFSLDGLGLLGYEAILTRDYPIIFGSLYIFTLGGLVLHLLSDLLYTWIDPRIDFHQRAGE